MATQVDIRVVSGCNTTMFAGTSQHLCATIHRPAMPGSCRTNLERDGLLPVDLDALFEENIASYTAHCTRPLAIVDTTRQSRSRTSSIPRYQSSDAFVQILSGSFRCAQCSLYLLLVASAHDSEDGRTVKPSVDFQISGGGGMR